MTRTCGSFVLLVFLLAGCTTQRSISNSEYPDSYRSDNPSYKGELSEFDVIGVDPPAISEEQIGAALDEARPVFLRKGGAILLVQSGAPQPDEDMGEALEKYFTVGSFTGVPLIGSWGKTHQQAGAGEYSRALRLAAAKGGYETIVCYWGVLEAAQKNLPTKPVSWVPLVGWALPDEYQQMRIRLKVALVDVRTGNWNMFSSTPFADSALSSEYTRKQSGQDQVMSLKKLAYAAAAEELVRRYAR